MRTQLLAFLGLVPVALSLCSANAAEHTSLIPALATTGYCLAKIDPRDPQYVVYLPKAGSVTVDLSGTQGDLAVEWFHPESGETTKGKTVQGGGSVRFQTPFESKDTVLYLCRME